MKLPYQKFWVILWCWTTQIPVKQSVALCNLSEEAVRRWYDLFRSHLPINSEILERIVQLDEAYFKRISLLMGKQQGTRKLAYDIFFKKSVDKTNAVNFLEQYVKPRSKLRTDGSMIYLNIHKWWPVRHQKDIHNKWEFELTSEIEGVFGNLKTFIRRMYHHATPEKYHHATPEKMPEIVREFCFRFSSPEMFGNPLNYLEKSLTLVPFD
ncbi:MAG: transposase [Candidatus Moranbacteria bacterium]|nr:transposase [Candidatus Moranbacteria bacterium]